MLWAHFILKSRLIAHQLLTCIPLQMLNVRSKPIFDQNKQRVHDSVAHLTSYRRISFRWWWRHHSFNLPPTFWSAFLHIISYYCLNHSLGWDSVEASIGSTVRCAELCCLETWMIVTGASNVIIPVLQALYSIHVGIVQNVVHILGILQFEFRQNVLQNVVRFWHVCCRN